MMTPAKEKANYPDQTAIRDFIAHRAMAKGLAQSAPPVRLATAQEFCKTVLEGYWGSLCSQVNCSWRICKPPMSEICLDKASLALASETGASLTRYSRDHAGYLIGTIYTAMLPDDIRSKLGAFYTPPPLVERLIDLTTQAGFDWGKDSVIDLSCGGGAFLAPVGKRMLAANHGGSPAFVFASIMSRLRGVEIDPFAAWMSLVLLEATLLELCIAAKRRVPNIVTIGDALSIKYEKKFALVIGNPPYGKVTLSKEMRKVYERSLYGHANLYGLFTDLAVRVASNNGIISYVTPTSFMGGQYFKSLRKLLADEAPPIFMDFITDREGVFEDVLQETMLTVYRKTNRGPVTVNFLEQQTAQNSVSIKKVGTFKFSKGEDPWLLPRHQDQIPLFRKIVDMNAKLRDYGYSVSTGQLVWNRHKGQLAKRNSYPNTYPLIWAESVTSDGFRFRAKKRNHVPFFKVNGNQMHLVTKEPCVLVQRTTAKEQGRRLIAAVLPREFIETYGSVVVENHLNILKAKDGSSISPETISALLNTKVVDEVFRCINGSVAVSAYELNALPLPDKKQMAILERMVTGGAARGLIEKAIARMYLGSK